VTDNRPYARSTPPHVVLPPPPPPGSDDAALAAYDATYAIAYAAVVRWPSDDAFTLARAERVLPLLPALFSAAKSNNLSQLIDIANAIFDADQDAMGSFEASV
jgi:hypothetical protein